MSVINQMLRDLESRDPAAGPVPVKGGTHGRAGGRALRVLPVGGLILASVAVAAIAWWYFRPFAESLPRGSAAVTASIASESDAASQRPGGATPVQSAGKPAEAGRGEGNGDAIEAAALESVKLETGEQSSRLILGLAGTPGRVERDSRSRGGTVHLGGARFGAGLRVPALEDRRVRSVSLLPDGEDVVLRYRAVAGAAVDMTTEPAAGGAGMRVVLSFRAPPPEPETAEQPAQDGTEHEAAAASRSPERKVEAQAQETQRQRQSANPEPAEKRVAGDQGQSRPKKSDSETAAAGSVTRQRRPPTAQERAQAAYGDALTALRGDNQAKAESLLRQALNLDPQQASARQALAMLLMKSGRTDAAEDLLRRGLRRGVRTPALITLYARTLLARSRLDEAVAVMEQGRTRAAGDAEYMATLAALYQRQSRYAEAAGAYRAALNQRPDAAAWWAGLGISLENVGRNQPARRAYSEAVRRGGLGSALSEYVRERLQALE